MSITLLALVPWMTAAPGQQAEHTGITEAGVENLKESLPHLEVCYQ